MHRILQKDILQAGLICFLATGCATNHESADHASTLNALSPESVAEKASPVPKTISEEAQAFLTRVNGDIIQNYLLNKTGNYVLPDIHRKAAPDMKIEPVEINGVNAFWFSSRKASGTNAVIVYFHGGGWVEGTGKEDGAIVFPVYEEAGIRGLSVDYRLAPQHPFPAAVEDAKNVFQGLLDNGYKPEQIALIGDSAGGNIILGATLSLIQENKPIPAAIAVISPATDLTMFGDSAITISHSDPFLKLDDSRFNISKYAGSSRRDDPVMSPVYGNFSGFPPLLIQVGTREVLLSDAVRLARVARQAGVDVTLDVWEGMWHAWHMTWPEIPEARKASEEIAHFLGRHLKHIKTAERNK